MPADAKNTKTLDAAGEGAMMRREQWRPEQEKKKKGNPGEAAQAESKSLILTKVEYKKKTHRL